MAVSLPALAGPVATRRDWLLVLILLAAIFLAYQPAWQGGFVWDDDLHLLDNPVLLPGGVFRTWLPGTHVNYWPLTSTVYWLEYQLWGFNSLGFHLVNIALHAVSAILIWRVLLSLQVPGAMFAAALFALHPVNVESVAWIAQLKNTLSLTLTLVSLLLYLRHQQRGGRWLYAAALGAFALATLSKGMTLTLPIVLLTCAWWQRGRIDRRDLLRVLPFALIGLAMVAIEVFQQHLAAAGDVVRCDGWLSRAAVAGCAVWFYLWKLIWPTNLAFVYPRWDLDAVNAWWFLPGFALLTLLVIAWHMRRSWGRPLVVLIVGYVALLLPALGFVNIYFMQYSLVADHWQYAAMIVPCAVLSGVMVTTARRWEPLLRVLSVAILMVLAILTLRQSRMYADAETLYRMTIDQNPGCPVAHNNLANLLAEKGRTGEAIDHYRKALDAGQGRNLANAHNNLGGALIAGGRFHEAISHFQEALKIRPDFAAAQLGLGNALAADGQHEEAIRHFRQAIALRPDYVEAHNNLASALTKRGRTEEAATHLRIALALRPNYAEAHLNLGNVWAAEGRLDLAAAEFRNAFKCRPGYVEARCNLASALSSSGRFEQAIAEYHQALKARPDMAAVANELAWLLATCPKEKLRNGAEAVVLAERAVRLVDGKQPEMLGTLAAAYAATGQYRRAAATAHAAVELAARQNRPALAAELQSRIAAYESMERATTPN